MRKILCFLGFHKWKMVGGKKFNIMMISINKRPTIIHQCECCGKLVGKWVKPFKGKLYKEIETWRDEI